MAETFFFDDSFHILADLLTPMRDGDVKAVVTGDLHISPLPPPVVGCQQRLTLGRYHEVDCTIQQQYNNRANKYMYVYGMFIREK